MAKIRRDDIDLLRQQADIVAVASDHTKLKRSGARMKGLCPFHTEKTPSFTVDPQQNLWYCFGCSEGGDIYDFLMRVEGLDFTEAVEKLARMTGFTLHYENMTAGQRRALGQRSRMVEVTRAAATFFRERLYSDEGDVARDYLKQRGFGKEDADRFALGFAPNDWDRLSRHLITEGYDRSLVKKAGIAEDGRGGKIRDRFRGRLIFPVRDVSGDPIGFGGRVLPGLDYGDYEPPKYYNSPETPLYKKTRVLYGLHEGRSEIVRAGQVLVCEGYTDVMALHQAGYGQAVATCGTAVGLGHLRILSRYADRVVLAFDADDAGAGAARKAWEQARELAEEGDGRTLDLRVLILPEGHDPADMVEAEGVEALSAAVEDATPVLPFLLRRTIREAGQLDERDRAAVLRELLELLGTEPDLDLRRVYAEREIARPLGVSLDYVVTTAARQDVALDRHEGVDAGTIRSADRRRGIAAVDRSRARLERGVLRAALQAAAHLPEEWYELDADVFAHPTAQEVYRAIEAAGGAGTDVAAVLDAAADGDTRRVVRELAMEEPDGELTGQVVADLVRTLLAGHLKQEADARSQELRVLHRDADPERWQRLNRELSELRRRRKQLLAARD